MSGRDAFRAVAEVVGAAVLAALLGAAVGLAIDLMITGWEATRRRPQPRVVRETP